MPSNTTSSNSTNSIASESHQKEHEFLPLSIALEQIAFYLEPQTSPRTIVATLSADELRRQLLPAHCWVKKRTLQGQRVPVRGRQKTAAVAHWPKDGLVESGAAELIFVLEGECDLRFSDYILHCKAGDTVFVPARLPKFDGERPVYETITPDAQCTLLFIRCSAYPFQNVSVNIAHSLGELQIVGKKGEAAWHENPYLGQLFVILSDRLQNKNQGKSTFHLLRSLVRFLMEEIEDGAAFDSTAFPSDSSATLREDAIQQAARYIRNHVNSPLTIDQIARWVGLSRSVFTVRFRQEMGKTFKEFHNEIRLERAKVLLQQTDLPIEHISERIGVTSGQMRQLFHQKLCCSPRQFRQARRQMPAS